MRAAAAPGTHSGCKDQRQILETERDRRRGRVQLGRSLAGGRRRHQACEEQQRDRVHTRRGGADPYRTAGTCFASSCFGSQPANSGLSARTFDMTLLTQQRPLPVSAHDRGRFVAFDQGPPSRDAADVGVRRNTVTAVGLG